MDEKVYLGVRMRVLVHRIAVQHGFRGSDSIRERIESWKSKAYCFKLQADQ